MPCCSAQLAQQPPYAMGNDAAFAACRVGSYHLPANQFTAIAVALQVHETSGCHKIVDGFHEQRSFASAHDRDFVPH